MPDWTTKQIIDAVLTYIAIPLAAALIASSFTAWNERRKRQTEQRTAAAMMATYLAEYLSRCRRAWYTAGSEMYEPNEGAPTFRSPGLAAPLESPDLKKLTSTMSPKAAAAAFRLHLIAMRTLDAFSHPVEDPYSWDEFGPLELARLVIEADKALREVVHAADLDMPDTESVADVAEWRDKLQKKIADQNKSLGLPVYEAG